MEYSEVCNFITEKGYEYFDLVKIAKRFSLPLCYVEENAQIVPYRWEIQCPHGPSPIYMVAYPNEPIHEMPLHKERIRMEHIVTYNRPDRRTIYAGRCNICGKIYVQRSISWPEPKEESSC